MVRRLIRAAFHLLENRVPRILRQHRAVYGKAFQSRTLAMGLQVDPTTALKVFMFFFVGGLAGIADLAIGGQPSFVPLVIILAGFGAVACVEFFIRTRH